MKKILLIIAGSVLVILVTGIVYVVNSNGYMKDGEVKLTGLAGPVKVIRDGDGIPYIYAESVNDGIFAQGFVTAQDRLFQMELLRRFATGKLSEFVGAKALKLDQKLRALGFGHYGAKHAKILDKKTSSYLARFVEGINEYITAMTDEHHLEFSLAGFKPQPWKIEDVIAICYYLGWNQSANIKAEVLAQMLIEQIGLEKASGLIPGMKKVTGKAAVRGLEKDEFLMAVADMQHRWLALGSNNWVTAPSRSAGKGAIFANDPHLETEMAPGPLYPLCVITPEVKFAGGAIPGLPGIITGRNEHIAFGITNSYHDSCDLYIETVDANNKKNYLEGNKSVPFITRKETIYVKDSSAKDGKRVETVTIKSTKRGPVVSGLLKGLKTKHVITMRFAPYENMKSGMGLDDLVLAKNTAQFKEGLAKLSVIMVNVVWADSAGNIGWKTTGSIPRRIPKVSARPFRVTSGKDNWKSFIPFNEMPGKDNPKEGWLGTCNHNTVGKNYRDYISTYFAPPYRFMRLSELMKGKKKFTAEDHFSYQHDTKNMLAQRIVPVFVKALKKSDETKNLARVLEEWDLHDNVESAGAIVFHAVYRAFVYQVFQDDIKGDVFTYFLDLPYFWQERVERMLGQKNSSWFDIAKTDKVEGRDDLIAAAGKFVLAAMGDDPEEWRWGDHHTLTFVSPIKRKGIFSAFLGGGKHAMNGSFDTLLRGGYKFSKKYEVYFSAGMRMVADLDDDDKIYALCSTGPGGRLFEDETTSHVDAYIKGKKKFIYFSDKEIEAHGKYRLSLVPQ